jgi:hypothetical protein
MSNLEIHQQEFTKPWKERRFRIEPDYSLGFARPGDIRAGKHLTRFCPFLTFIGVGGGGEK